jgi:hypothetical protein
VQCSSGDLPDKPIREVGSCSSVCTRTRFALKVSGARTTGFVSEVLKANRVCVRILGGELGLRPIFEEELGLRPKLEGELRLRPADFSGGSGFALGN